MPPFFPRKYGNGKEGILYVTASSISCVSWTSVSSALTISLPNAIGEPMRPFHWQPSQPPGLFFSNVLQR